MRRLPRGKKRNLPLRRPKSVTEHFHNHPGLLLGLTGGIATGKSSVTAVLEELGAHIVEADQVSRAIQVPGSPVLEAIAREFGPEFIRADGTLDRSNLGHHVFARPQELLRLNALMREPLGRAVLDAARSALDRFPVVVVSAAILMEYGLDGEVDQVWLVVADEQQQVERQMSRNGLTELQARQRMSAQIPVAEARARAHVIIDNSGGFEATRDQVLAAWNRLVAPRLNTVQQT